MDVYALYGWVAAEKRAHFPAGLAKVAITHVHLLGHQRDESYFTRLNCYSDALAGLGRAVDVHLHDSVLEDLAAGPMMFAARLEQADRDFGRRSRGLYF